MKTVFQLLAFIFLGALLCQGAAAQELRIAAAADLQFAFQDVSAKFQKQSGHAVKLTFGSSGNFYSQIKNGAPFDMFFSADLEYPARLDKEGFAEPGTFVRYTTGKIVLWVRKDSPIDVTKGLQALLDARVHKISIANPQHAPYGRAAVAAMKHEKLYDEVQDRLVFGENIAQAAQFVESGNADAGILALSLASAPPLNTEGNYYEIPASSYPPIQQGVVILKSSKHKDIARQFLAFVKRPEIMDLMGTYGFAVPQ